MPKKFDFMQNRPRRGNVVLFVARSGKMRLGEVLTDPGASQEELFVQDAGGARNRMKFRDVLLNLGEAPAGLAARQQQIEQAAAQIDLALLLEAHPEWNKGPGIPVRAITEEYFGAGAESGQEAAVYFALQRDERFALSGERVLYRPPAHNARRRGQHERQQLFDSLRATMTEALQQNWAAAAINSHPLGKRLARLARATLEQRRLYPQSWRKEFVIHLHSLNTLTGYRDARHLIFDWLEKVGRVPPDADLFVFSEPMLRQHVRRLQTRNASPSLRSFISPNNVELGEQPEVVITIDNPETVDRDDALSFRRTAGGVEIGVHTPLLEILVPQGTEFDIWAYDVGASAYMPHRIVPMLPAAISSDLGSLNAGNERPVLSFYFAVAGDQTARLDRVVCESLDIDLNTDYERVDATLPEISWNELAQGKANLNELKKSEYEQLPLSFGEALQAWTAVAVHLEKQRLSNGAKTFNRDEVEVKVGADGVITLRHISRDSVAHKMVAEWMIAANQAAAQFCHENNLPCIYRVQEVLGPEREDEEGAARTRAQLKPERAPHHDLGVDGYTQITSPLRRYGDLVMQRQITAFLQTGKPLYSQTDLWARALSIEEMTRRIQRLESRADFYWKCVYLSQHLGETYTARIGRSQGVNPRIILQLLDLDLRLYVPPSGMEGVVERKIPPHYSPVEVQVICLAMDAEKATMRFKMI